MNIVYTNRRPDEARVHIEIDAEEVAAIEARDPDPIHRLWFLIQEANRRLNPATEVTQ